MMNTDAVGRPGLPTLTPTLMPRLADGQKLTKVLRDKPRHDLVRQMSTAFSAEDFDSLETTMQKAKERETLSRDYRQAVAEAV
jgi:hypothetical protein